MRRITLGVTFTMLLASIAGAQFVQQGSKLVAAGAIGKAWAGTVAVSADGSTIIVGGPDDDGGRGAAWVFTRSDGGWGQQGGKLVGTGAGGDRIRLGVAVALSADGNTAIVGAPEDEGNLGAAWVFTRSNGGWTQQGGKLVGTNSERDWAVNQGAAVALSADGNTALVGGPGDKNGAGATWVFTRAGGVWTQQGGKLIGTGAAKWEYQGTSVALSADGDTAIVSAPLAEGYRGAAWVFTRTGGTWSQQGDKLVPTGTIGDVNLYSTVTVAISADGGTTILGRPDDDGGRGATWVFVRSAGAWTQQGDKLVGLGAAGSTSYQGTSVALSGNGETALVGAPGDGGSSGATWVFTRTRGEWRQQGEKVVGTGAVGRAMQGFSVALSAGGETAVVGASADNGGIGAVWVFTGPARTNSSLWVPVVAHNPGVGTSQWRSDIGLLNPGPATASVQLTFHGAGGAVTSSTYVPAGAQSLLVDVVAQLAASGQGALEISSEQPLRVTSRTYSQVADDASCHASGTLGQGYPTVTASEGLSESQAAWLPHLTENAKYRTNIGLVNTGIAAANVTIELHDGSGAVVTSYAVSLAPGEWKQETQPFRNRAGQANVHCGYAKVIVTSGSGVVALASVVDNITNDPTTITMQR
jgi:hypothetical protein